MALEGAATLDEALRTTQHNWDAALQLYQQQRVARTARVVLAARKMGRLYHAAGIERLVRNSPWKGRPHARYYDTIEWLYGWDVNNCLQQG
jgi:salicylate hydroxylase